MTIRKRSLAAAAIAVAALAPAQAAQDYVPAIQKLVEDGLRAEIGAAVVIEGVARQNAQTAPLDQAAVDALDQQWRAEVAAGGGALIAQTMANAVSAHLKAVQAKYAGLVTEIFVMDARGLNVGQSEKTSDYWQGDEAKFQKTYPVGAAAVFVDEVELDESTQTLQSQVSFTLTDATGAAVGAATVGVNVDLLVQ